MARASTRTLLPLDRWFALLGVNPIHANQCITAVMPQTICGTPWKQYPWQEANQIGREDIAYAIADAEKIIGRYVGYSLLPDWVADERMPTVQPGIPGLLNLTGRNLTGFRNTVQLSQGQFISGGIEEWTLINGAAAIVYSDEDGDGFDETATITVNTTVTEPCEIALVFPGETASTAGVWEVRPLRSVTITAGVATIVAWRVQLPLPELWEALVPEAIDADVDANFLTTAGVWRHWNNPEQQVQFLWSPLPWGLDACGSCGDSDCVSCTAYSQYGCLLGNNYRLGLVHFEPGTWDATNSNFTGAGYSVGRQPDRLRLWYQAGWQDNRQVCPTLQMDPTFERAVAYLALALLDREICSCSNLESLFNHYREDLALVASTPAESRSYNLGQSQMLNNPFGTTRGAVYAWNAINAQGRKIGRAVNL